MAQLLLISEFPFYPLPLIQSLQAEGHSVWCDSLPNARQITGHLCFHWEKRTNLPFDAILLLTPGNPTPSPQLLAKARQASCPVFFAVSEPMVGSPDPLVIPVVPGQGEEIPMGQASRLPFPSAERLTEVVCSYFSQKRFQGMQFLITAGPTVEDVDPARFISNRSSGKMGTAIARMAARHGARVLLIHGPMQAKIPPHPAIKTIAVRSAAQMKEAVMQHLPGTGIAILCAAVADFQPAHYTEFKIKKNNAETFQLDLKKTPDILAGIGQSHPRPYLVGFAAESNKMEENAWKKLCQKHCDLICANNILQKGCGFSTETNSLTIFGKHFRKVLPLASKQAIAESLCHIIYEQYQTVAQPPKQKAH